MRNLLLPSTPVPMIPNLRPSPIADPKRTPPRSRSPLRGSRPLSRDSRRTTSRSRSPSQRGTTPKSRSPTRSASRSLIRQRVSGGSSSRRSLRARRENKTPLTLNTKRPSTVSGNASRSASLILKEECTKLIVTARRSLLHQSGSSGGNSGDRGTTPPHAFPSSLPVLVMQHKHDLGEVVRPASSASCSELTTVNQLRVSPNSPDRDSAKSNSPLNSVMEHEERDSGGGGGIEGEKVELSGGAAMNPASSAIGTLPDSLYFRKDNGEFKKVQRAEVLARLLHEDGGGSVTSLATVAAVGSPACSLVGTPTQKLRKKALSDGLSDTLRVSDGNNFTEAPLTPPGGSCAAESATEATFAHPLTSPRQPRRRRNSLSALSDGPPGYPIPLSFPSPLLAKKLLPPCAIASDDVPPSPTRRQMAMAARLKSLQAQAQHDLSPSSPPDWVGEMSHADADAGGGQRCGSQPSTTAGVSLYAADVGTVVTLGVTKARPSNATAGSALAVSPRPTKDEEGVGRSGIFTVREASAEIDGKVCQGGPARVRPPALQVDLKTRGFKADDVDVAVVVPPTLIPGNVSPNNVSGADDGGGGSVPSSPTRTLCLSSSEGALPVSATAVRTAMATSMRFAIGPSATIAASVFGGSSRKLDLEKPVPGGGDSVGTDHQRSGTPRAFSQFSAAVDRQRWDGGGGVSLKSSAIHRAVALHKADSFASDVGAKFSPTITNLRRAEIDSVSGDSSDYSLGLEPGSPDLPLVTVAALARMAPLTSILGPSREWDRGTRSKATTDDSPFAPPRRRYSSISSTKASARPHRKRGVRTRGRHARRPSRTDSPKTPESPAPPRWDDARVQLRGLGLNEGSVQALFSLGVRDVDDLRFLSDADLREELPHMTLIERRKCLAAFAPGPSHVSQSRTGQMDGNADMDVEERTEEDNTAAEG